MLLQADHKPARGRGRHLQLQTMTAEMIAAEAASRLAKNRDAARDSTGTLTCISLLGPLHARFSVLRCRHARHAPRAVCPTYLPRSGHTDSAFAKQLSMDMVAHYYRMLLGC